MFDGKEKRLALIDELLIVASTKKINQKDEQKLVNIKKEQAKEEAMQKGLQGKILSSELVQVTQNQHKINDMENLTKFMKAAEKERKIRENQETGTRQAEIILKNREERLHEEVMQVHQNTVGKTIKFTIVV